LNDPDHLLDLLRNPCDFLFAKPCANTEKSAFLTGLGCHTAEESIQSGSMAEQTHYPLSETEPGSGHRPGAEKTVRLFLGIWHP
jgi:hypothetical protein